MQKIGNFEVAQAYYDITKKPLASIFAIFEHYSNWKNYLPLLGFEPSTPAQPKPTLFPIRTKKFENTELSKKQKLLIFEVIETVFFGKFHKKTE
jgi:hypothetical protein